MVLKGMMESKIQMEICSSIDKFIDQRRSTYLLN